MYKLGQAVVSFLENEDGATATEHAIVLALILMVCSNSLKTLATKTSSTFTNVATQISKAS